MPITVIDAMCGTGKTQGAIKYMNERNKDSSFIYITPYKKEIDRIIKACPALDFQTGRDGRKVYDLRSGLAKGKNFCCTHEAFLYLDENDIQFIKQHNYTVICDEVLDVIEIAPSKPADVEFLRNNFLDIDSNGEITLNETGESYDGEAFKEELQLIKRKRMILTDDNKLIRLFPADLLRAAKDVFILTYMFPFTVMRCYCELTGIDYKVFTMKEKNWDWDISPHDGYYYEPWLSSLFDIYNGKHNEIGMGRTALSKGFFGLNGNVSDYMKKKRRNILKRALYNVLHNDYRAKGNSILWTIWKGLEDTIATNGYKKRFAPCNIRATNRFRQCTNLVYAVNSFPNVYLQTFFKSHGIILNADGWALSELIQFVMRSAARDGERVNIYIPSERMRTLFSEFLAHGIKATI